MQKIKTIKQKKAGKLTVFCKFDSIAQNSSELVTWFDYKILVEVRILQIPLFSRSINRQLFIQLYDNDSIYVMTARGSISLQLSSFTGWSL